MSGHVSQLVLDEIASGLSTDAHVEGCAECSAKLAAIKKAREQSVQSFGYARTKARVTAERPSRLRELMPFLVPVLATALFFVVASYSSEPKVTERVKGAASIDFVLDGKVVTEAKPGVHVQMKLGTAGNGHALVLAIDKDRKIDELFAGPVTGGFVTKDFEVTPGSLAVHAFLSNVPVDPKVVIPAMENAIRDYGGWPLEAPPPKLDNVTVVSQRLYVNP